MEFLAVNIAWQPQTGLHVGAPGIEVQIVFVLKCFQRKTNCRGIGPTNAYDGVVLIFDPDLPDKAGAPRVRRRGHLETNASHLAQELSLWIIELIVRLIELPSVDVNHLQESGGFEGPHQRTLFTIAGHRVNFDSPPKIRLA